MGAKKLQLYKIRAYPDQSRNTIKNNIEIFRDSRGVPVMGQNKGGYFLEFLVVARSLQEALSDVLPQFNHTDEVTVHGISWETE